MRSLVEARRHVDLEARAVVVHRQVQELRDTVIVRDPKTAAGRRTVALPDFVAEALVDPERRRPSSSATAPSSEVVDSGARRAANECSIRGRRSPLKMACHDGRWR
jgi:hypothetical protein